MTPIHIQWADDGQHIRKWAHDPFAGSTEYAAIATPMADDAVVTISGKTLHDYVDRAHVRQRIGELMDEEEGGFWRACSGCQESVDGCVSTTDYPYDETFRCQPGSGCRECGGIGVIWDDADYSQMASDMARDDAPVTVERLRAQLQAKIRAGFCAEDTEDGDVNFCGECHWCLHILSERRLAALASAPAGDDRRKVLRLTHFMAEQAEREAVVDWLRKTGDSMKPGTEWRAYYAAAEAIETEQHLPAALARPRAAVGERYTFLGQAAQEAYRVCAETRHVTLGDKVRAAILALQSAPAKVER